MDVLYRTIKERVRNEFFIEKSRFITTIAPASSRAEAEAFFREIKEEFKDATHNVPAFVLAGNPVEKWCSDAGEPQGTAGIPLLMALDGALLQNVAAVATRYFGGIKLGTGGLSRAYSACAKEAMKNAKKYNVCELIVFNAIIDYQSYNKISNIRTDMNFEQEALNFTDKVELKIKTAPEDEEGIKSLITDITSGTAVFSDVHTEASFLALSE